MIVKKIIGSETNDEEGRFLVLSSVHGKSMRRWQNIWIEHPSDGRVRKYNIRYISHGGRYLRIKYGLLQKEVIDFEVEIAGVKVPILRRVD